MKNRKTGATHPEKIRRYFLMKIIRAKDYYDMSRKAANIISAQVIMKPNCVLGLATGVPPVARPSTQLGFMMTWAEMMLAALRDMS